VPERFLITGIDGFIGSWLERALREQGHTVFGLSRTSEDQFKLRGDITDRAAVDAAIRTSEPRYVFHLAAQNNIMRSISHPEETVSVNLGGTLNLLESVQTLSPASRIISVGSSAEYGRTAGAKTKVDESDSLLPSSGYGITKAAQGMLASVFARAFGLDVIHVRPFAIIGPGKRGDALSDFCQAIVAIERGSKTTLTVGNLTAVRDFMDVRDCVSALLLVARAGAASETYNVCNGSEASLQDVVAILKALSRADIPVQADPARMRCADELRLVGNNAKLVALGYSAGYDLKKTVSDTLTYWRARDQ
jgi:GDP-4-dehydro-6-deoxy-D-mannose reductase